MALSLAQGVTARAAEIKVIAGVAMREIGEELAPVFERATGHKTDIWYGTTTAIRQRIEAGAAFDVALFGRTSLDEYTERGKIAAGTRTAIARVGMGVGVRAGALRPDISSVDAFKRALLNAKSLAYNPEGAGGIHLIQVSERLGIAEQIKAKARPVTKGVVRAIADGTGELGFAFVNELLSAADVELVAPFPPELQRYNVFTAAAASAAEQPQAAEAFIRFLRSRAAVAVIKAKGMEPATP
ncbi:MAG: molybdate ABC transporter substrate-binding protein [Burkholderiales bacterium]